MYIIRLCKPDFISLVEEDLFSGLMGGEKSHRPLSREQGF